jgi:hypothetical protein
MGLVLQEDAAWQDQSGSPRDPQGGNLPGGRVDVRNNPGTSGEQTIYATLLRSAPASTTAVDFLTDAQLAPIVAEAKRLWAAALGGAGAAALDRLQVVIGDLPQGRLGALTSGLIVIDGTAAGRGWFIDPTPWDNSEFTYRRGSTTLVANGSSPAYGRVDLLTVVMHEIGHALGRDHEPTGAMADVFRAGERQTEEPAAAVDGDRAHPPAARTSKGRRIFRPYRR